ncbi:MAG: pyruvate, phosphate dikinase, partial [Chloroflexi bacterium]|nr:pyruvate, phosphate dikinase [Chloroflexota bacterium]
MKNPFVLPLSDPHADPNTVGGKGASLARLANAGLPIPDGFHVTTEAYRRFVDENKLQPKIEAALQAIDLSAPQTLEKASQVIRALFLQATLPPQVTSAIAAAYAALSEDAPAVAVRSSATAEDLPEASFAGQQDTFLNIRGVDPLLQATRACWASLWTGRAIGYRARREIAADCVALAVVVQHLIPAEAA